MASIERGRQRLTQDNLGPQHNDDSNNSTNDSNNDCVPTVAGQRQRLTNSDNSTATIRITSNNDSNNDQGRR